MFLSLVIVSTLRFLNAPTTLCYIIIILLITAHSTIILLKLYHIPTRHQRKILDDTLPIRYSGLSNNAHLELVASPKSKKGNKMIAY